MEGCIYLHPGKVPEGSRESIFIEVHFLWRCRYADQQKGSQETFIFHTGYIGYPDNEKGMDLVYLRLAFHT